MGEEADNLQQGPVVAPPRAPFYADREAEHWSFGAPARPPESVTATINRFSPRNVPADRWRRVEPTVKETVRKVGFTDAELAKKTLSVVAQYALWADRIGQPVDAASLFTPQLIDRFVTEGLTHLTSGTRLNYRSQLWRVGAAVKGHTLFPPRVVPLRASDLLPPYTEAQIRDLYSWSQALSTGSMRRNCRALFACGLGAGMQSEEISRAVGTDVFEEDGVVLVNVLGTGGRVARVVPVSHRWARVLFDLAHESAERPLFRPERTAIHRNDVLGFIRRCTPEEKARFTVQRLRITWLVAHLSAGTHLRVLERAYGVAAIQAVKYLGFATAPDEVTARGLLAGVH